MQSKKDTAVFISTCGGTLDDRLDVAALKKRFGSEEGVRIYEADSWSSPGDRETMARNVQESGAPAVVVAGASPLVSARPSWVPLEDDTAARIETANLREQCAWVHPDRKVATAKAERLIEVALARARRAAPLRVSRRPVERRVAVIGSGAEACAAARNLAAARLDVLLVPPAGDETPLRPATDEARAGLEKLDNVSVAEPGDVVALEGSVGNFRLTVGTNGRPTSHEVGVIVCAVDAVSAPLEPTGGAVSLDDFEGSRDRDAVCVRLDAEEFSHKYDAKRALDSVIAHQKAGGKCTVLYRHMPVFGMKGQAQFDEARLAGVRFVRVTGPGPVIGPEGGRIGIEARDEVLPERTLSFLVDRVVLPSLVRPARSYASLSRLLGQPLDEEGYLQPSNVRHAPLATARRGVFFVGRCHQDVDDAESELEAEALVSQVLGVLPADATVEVPEEVLSVDVSQCASCLTCLRLCPHGAIAMREKGMAQSVTFEDSACYECGICAAACPREAIRHGSLSNEALHEAARVAAGQLLGRAPVVVLACRQGAVQAADGAGRLGLALPDEVVIVDVPCAGRIGETLILDVLLAGAAGVVVLGCHSHNCRSLHGSDAARHRSERVRRTLDGLGLPLEKVQFHGVAANEPDRLAHILADAVGAIGEASKE